MAALASFTRERAAEMSAFTLKVDRSRALEFALLSSSLECFLSGLGVDFSLDNYFGVCDLHCVPVCITHLCDQGPELLVVGWPHIENLIER